MEFPFQPDDELEDGGHHFGRGLLVCLICLSVLIVLGFSLTRERELATSEPAATDNPPAVETQQPTSDAAPKPPAMTVNSRPKRRSRSHSRPHPRPAQPDSDSLTLDVLVAKGRVQHASPVYYGPVDISQAHSMMQNAILRSAAEEGPPLTPENSGENALKKALADGWQTHSTETFGDPSGRITKRYHLTKMKEPVPRDDSP
jgi:hypothetical protein